MTGSAKGGVREPVMKAGNGDVRRAATEITAPEGPAGKMIAPAPGIWSGAAHDMMPT
jgi:hypothetical protein